MPGAMYIQVRYVQAHVTRAGWPSAPNFSSKDVIVPFIVAAGCFHLSKHGWESSTSQTCREREVLLHVWGGSRGLARE